MTGGGGATPDRRSGAPVDFDRYDAIRERFEIDSRFSTGSETWRSGIAKNRTYLLLVRRYAT